MLVVFWCYHGGNRSNNKHCESCYFARHIIKAFDAIERGKHFARDHVVLLARLDIQQEMLLIWGRTVGLSAASDASLAERLLETRVRRLIQTHLECVQVIFDDVDQLKKKYGLININGSGYAITDHRQVGAVSEANIQPTALLRARLSWTQKHTSLVVKGKWAIHDGSRFKCMVAELEDLIADLRDLTTSIAELNYQQHVFAGQIEASSSTEDLEYSRKHSAKKTLLCPRLQVSDSLC